MIKAHSAAVHISISQAARPVFPASPDSQTCSTPARNGNNSCRSTCSCSLSLPLVLLQSLSLPPPSQVLVSSRGYISSWEGFLGFNQPIGVLGFQQCSFISQGWGSTHGCTPTRVHTEPQPRSFFSLRGRRRCSSLRSALVIHLPSPWPIH